MNWKQMATERLSQYEDVRCARENLEQEIGRLRGILESPGHQQTELPARTGKSREDWLLKQLVELGELELRQQQTRQWLESTDRALAALKPEEKLVLYRLFIQPKKNNVERLCGELGTERSGIYRRRDAALRHFTRALYGPV